VVVAEVALSWNLFQPSPFSRQQDSIRTSDQSTATRVCSPFPYESVEYPLGAEVEATVKFDGAAVGFGDGKREKDKSPLAKVGGGGRQQGFSNSMGAVFGKNA
jgi:hypothetical protein